MKSDPEDEPAMTKPVAVTGEPIMNNGNIDKTLSDIEKLEQQLQDIKEQVCIRFY